MAEVLRGCQAEEAWPCLPASAEGAVSPAMKRGGGQEEAGMELRGQQEAGCWVQPCWLRLGPRWGPRGRGQDQRQVSGNPEGRGTRASDQNPKDKKQLVLVEH